MSTISEPPAITLTASGFPAVSGDKIKIILRLIKSVGTSWKVLQLTHKQQAVKYLAQTSNEYITYKVSSDLLRASGRQFVWLRSGEGSAGHL